MTDCKLDSITATSFDDGTISATDCFGKAIHVSMDVECNVGGSGHRFCIIGLPCNELKISTAAGVALNFACDASHGVFVVLQANANIAFAPAFALHEKPLVAMTSHEFNIWWGDLQQAVSYNDVVAAGKLLGLNTLGNVSPKGCLVKAAPVKSH
jgi:hypothetical protein